MSGDIDQILRSIQGPDANRSLSDKHASEAPHLLTRKDGYLRVLVAPPAKYFPASSMIRTDPLATATAFLDEHQAAFGLEDALFGFVPKAIKNENREKSYGRLQDLHGDGESIDVKELEIETSYVYGSQS